MFEESLVESTSLLHTRNRWPALLSFAAQALVATAIVAIPLLHPEVLTTRIPPLTTLAPPHFPPRVPPPVQRVHAEATSTTQLSAPAPASPASSGFSLIHLAPLDSVPDGPPATTNLNLGGSSTPGSPLGEGTAPAGPNVVAAPTRPTGSFKVSQGVIAGLLIAPIQPVYPPIARASHTQGTVVIQAIISKTGRIESAHVLSGSPMLQNAALEAVRSARYHPYLLNGEPTEVDTTISINFILGT